MAKRSGSVLPGGGFNKWLSLSVTLSHGFVPTRRGLSTVREIQAAPPSRVFHDQTSGQAQGTSSLGSRGAYGQVGGMVFFRSPQVTRRPPAMAPPGFHASRSQPTSQPEAASRLVVPLCPAASPVLAVEHCRKCHPYTLDPLQACRPGHGLRRKCPRGEPKQEYRKGTRLGGWSLLQRAARVSSWVTHEPHVTY